MVKKIRRRRTELGDICETHGPQHRACAPERREINIIYINLLIDIAFASSNYKLKKLQYQKYKTEENLQTIARNLVRSNNKITS